MHFCILFNRTLPFPPLCLGYPHTLPHTNQNKNGKHRFCTHNCLWRRASQQSPPPYTHTHTHTDCSFSSPLTPNTIWRSWGSFLSPIGSVQGPAKRNSRHWLSAPFQQHSQKMQGGCPMELSVLYHPNTSKHGPEFNHPLGRLVCLWFCCGSDA